MNAERRQPWHDKHGKRIWELEYHHSYRCLNMAEVREFLDKKAHTSQVSMYHETDGSITELNRMIYRKSFFQRQLNYLTQERNDLNDNIKSLEESIRYFGELVEEMEKEKD
jgi:hypothetical protein